MRGRFYMALELGEKYGPLPVWGWAVVVAVGGYVIYKRWFSGGSSTVQNTVSPGQQAGGDASGFGGSTPIYVGGTGTTPASAGATGGNGTDGLNPDGSPTIIVGPQNTSGISNSIDSLFPGASKFAQNGEVAQKGHYDGGIQPFLGYGPGLYVNPDGSISEAPGLGGRQSAANLFAALGTPAQLPVGDAFGAVGFISPDLARAGGYWGAGGQWVPSATGLPGPGQPAPIGTLPPFGPPYVTGAGTGNALNPNGVVQGVPGQIAGH